MVSMCTNTRLHWFTFIKFARNYNFLKSCTIHLYTNKLLIRHIGIFIQGHIVSFCNGCRHDKAKCPLFAIQISKVSQILTYAGYVVSRIYPIELEIQDTTDAVKSVSYLDLHLKIDNEGRLKTKLYDKREDLLPNFELSISMQQHLAPTYRVYISKLIQYSRACIS